MIFLLINPFKELNTQCDNEFIHIFSWTLKMSLKEQGIFNLFQISLTHLIKICFNYQLHLNFNNFEQNNKQYYQ